MTSEHSTNSEERGISKEMIALIILVSIIAIVICIVGIWKFGLGLYIFDLDVHLRNMTLNSLHLISLPIMWYNQAKINHTYSVCLDNVELNYS